MKRPSLHQGFAAIAAIFLVVGLAALGAFMVTFSNTQQLTSAQDIQGTKAYWAARAGLESAIGGLSATTSPVCPTSTPYSLDDFSVTITCAYVTVTDVTPNTKLFQLVSTATSGSVGAMGYIERSVSAALEK
jgi:MSHA biogenesis protein MshP